MKRRPKIESYIFIILVLIISIILLTSFKVNKNDDNYYVEPAAKLYEKINVGFNLGMSFSAYDKNSPYEVDSIEKVNKYELKWCNTITKKELFAALKNRGFNFIRISVDLYNHINEDDVIDELWLKRIDEIINWCLDLDLYVSIDITETYGLYLSNEPLNDFINSNMVYRFKKFWQVIAARYKEIDGHLLFEPFNEILNEKHIWNTNHRKEINNLNELYKIFIDVIRNSGGYNKNRNLLIPSYGGSSNNNLTYNMMLANDNHLIIDIHLYEPIRFCFNETNLGSTDFKYTFGSYEDIVGLQNNFIDLRLLSNRLNVPVLIGEFGVVNLRRSSEINKYLNYYMKYSRDNNIKVVYFDDSWDFKIIDRESLTFNEDIVNILLNK